MSDSEILNLILVSKEKGYCALTDSYANYVYAIVCSVLGKYGTEEDVEECITDIFVKLVMDTTLNLKPFVDVLGDAGLEACLGVSSQVIGHDVYSRLARFVESDGSIPGYLSILTDERGDSLSFALGVVSSSVGECEIGCSADSQVVGVIGVGECEIWLEKR